MAAELNGRPRQTLEWKRGSSVAEHLAVQACIARNDFTAILAWHQTCAKYPVSINDLQAAPHPTLTYYGTDDTHLDLARQQARTLPCPFEQVPGDHVLAFAHAASILPAATAHFDAAASR